MITDKKYYISECLMIKNENQYLHEHIVSDVEAGIDHFYIYDDKSDVPVKEYLKNNYPELLQYCTITIVDENFPEIGVFKNKQIRIYRHVLENYRSETVWVSFTDTDEIWEGDLKKFLKEREGQPSVFVPWVIHGSNGHVEKTGKTLKENFYDDVIPTSEFKGCKGDDFRDSMFVGKTVSQCDKLVELGLYSDIHATLPLDALKLLHVSKFNDTEFDYWTAPVIDLVKYGKEPEVKLHHYLYKSFEELLEKRLRGYAHLIDSRPNSSNTEEGVKIWAEKEWLDLDKYFDLNPEIRCDDEKVSELFYKFGINSRAFYKQSPINLTDSFIESNPESPLVRKHKLIVAKLNKRK